MSLSWYFHYYERSYYQSNFTLIFFSVFTIHTELKTNEINSKMITTLQTFQLCRHRGEYMHFLTFQNFLNLLLTMIIDRYQSQGACSCCKWVPYFWDDHVSCLSKTYDFSSKLPWIEDKICLFWHKTYKFQGKTCKFLNFSAPYCREYLTPI